MESRFGYDFGNLRIHTDEGAVNSAKALNARAYTLGTDLMFGAGRSSSTDVEGRKLIAHELVHVIQQTGIPSWSAVSRNDLSVSSLSAVTPISAIRSFSGPMIARKPGGGGGEVLLDNNVLVQLDKTGAYRAHEIGVTGRVYTIKCIKDEFLKKRSQKDWERLQKKFNIEVLKNPSSGVLANQRKRAKAAKMEMKEDWFTSVDARVIAASRERGIPLAVQDETAAKELKNWELS